MELPLLPDIVIILGLAVVIILLFQRLKLPPILGFLLTGIVAGPHGLSLINASHEVELLAEIGVIFLLFVIGIEFSLKGLASIKGTVFFGGLIQVGGTIGGTAVATYILGLPMNQAIFMGFLLSLSSTAIVLKLLQESGEVTSPHGRIATAILIFQDIAVVFMILLTPIMAGEADNLLLTLAILFGKVLGIIAVLIVLARYVVPVILQLVAKSKSRELFILAVVVLCFSTAWLTSSVGLSLALGAFFAGLIISESQYSHQATANILPFREIFMSFFFVSVGMLLDIKFFFQNVIYIHFLAFGVMGLKTLIAALAATLLRYPARTVILSALSIFQVGEFAFLLSETGMEHGLLTENVYQYFLAISIISMGATPFVIKYSGAIADFLVKAPLPPAVRRRLNAFARIRSANLEGVEELSNHLVIIGYGINGQNVAKAAKSASIQHIIIELDPDVIAEARTNGDPVMYGDAMDEVILKHVNIHEARVVVIAISDPDATKKIIRRIRDFTETAYVIVRTRYVKEIEENLKLGADEVIPEEFETSIEIFTRVLKKYLVTNVEIQRFISSIRSRNYEMLTKISGTEVSDMRQPQVPDMEIVTIKVEQGANKIVGKTVEESDLRSQFGVTVLAIRRDNKYITVITPNTFIKQDDVLYLFGHPEDISEVNRYMEI